MARSLPAFPALRTTWATIQHRCSLCMFTSQGYLCHVRRYLPTRNYIGYSLTVLSYERTPLRPIGWGCWDNHPSTNRVSKKMTKVPHNYIGFPPSVLSYERASSPLSLGWSCWDYCLSINSMPKKTTKVRPATLPIGGIKLGCAFMQRNP